MLRDIMLGSENRGIMLRLRLDDDEGYLFPGTAQLELVPYQLDRTGDFRDFYPGFNIISSPTPEGKLELKVELGCHSRLFTLSMSSSRLRGLARLSRRNLEERENREPEGVKLT